MKRTIITSLAALAIWSSVGLNFAAAQFGGLGQAPPRVRPTVSPFINLGQGGGIGSFYGIIKPQLDSNRSIYQLQQTMQHVNADGSLQGQLNQGQGNPLGGLQTGHSATFFNHSHYFPVTPGGINIGGNTGLGGAGLGLGTGGFGLGNTGLRGFYGSNLNQGLMVR